MKVCLKNFHKYTSENQTEVINKFLEFLQKEVPLSDNLEIEFLNKRKGKMTTGVRKPHSLIYVLAGKRMLADILRTVAHEWVHEYQHQKMGVSRKKKIKDIGGPEENMANVLSGIFIKKFQKANPDFEHLLYNE